MSKTKPTIYLILSFLFLFGASISSNAATITVSSPTIPNTCFNWGTNPHLRIIANNSFVTSTGAQVLGRLGANAFYKEVNCKPNISLGTPDETKFLRDDGTFATLPDITGGSTVETVAASLAELNTAITTANSTKGINYSVKLNGNITVTSALSIPADILISFVNNSKFTRTGAGTIAFAGKGLENPTAEKVVFYGFSPGNITWTGSEYPTHINNGLFDNATASARINMADRAFIGKKVEILATPGLISEFVEVNDGHSLTLGAGVFTNTSVFQPNIEVHSNVVIKGQGIGVTTVWESSDNTSVGSAAIIYASNIAQRGSGVAALEYNDNIIISDITFQGALSRDENQVASTVFLGNTHNGRIERNHFRRTHGFSAYFGVETTTSQYAKNSFILDNIFEDGGTQIAGSLNSDGLTISRNQFIDSGYYTKQYSYFIDLEPNAANCRMDNIIISDNIMNTTAPGRNNRNGIIVQAAGIDRVRNLTIQNNQISGLYLPDNAANLSTGIVIFNGEGVHIKNNTISGALQVGVKIANSSQIHVTGNTLIHVGSRNGGTMAMLFQGINDSIIKDNIFPKRNNYPSGLNEFIDRNHNDSAEIVEVEFGMPADVSTTGGVTTLKVSRLDEAVGFFDFWVNRRVYLSGGGSGVKEGYYTIASVNHAAYTATLTTVAGNGTGAAVGTRYSNNNYINNTNAYYRIKEYSNSFFTDSTTASPVYFYHTFAPGNLDTAYTLGNLNINQKTYFTIVSIEANSRVAPVGCSTNAVIEVTGDGGDGTGTQTIKLPLTAASNSVIGNAFYGNITRAVEVKVLTAAAGCSVYPSNFNVVVGYQTGVRITRVP